MTRYSARSDAPIKQQATLSAMYDNFQLLKSTFEFWDQDHNGRVDAVEFAKGVEHLNGQVRATAVDLLNCDAD